MKLLFPTQREALSAVLVALQFACMLLLPVMAWPTLRRGPVPWLTLLLGCACVALAAWTLLHNRLGNFNIRPLPKTGGRLVTSGPYQWIRHPMYTTVLLGGGALALVPSPALGGAVWATLALVLWVKSIVEERWLSERYATYRDYAAASKRFVPLVF